MKMEVFPIFFEIIAHSHLEKYKNKNNYFYEKVKEIREVYSNKSLHEWRCDTFCTQNYYDLEKDSEFQDIFEDIKNLVSEFSYEYGAKNFEPVLTSGWINLAPPGEYQEYHIHSNSHISVVYYIKTPPNCGKIVFRSHSADKEMLEMPLVKVTKPSVKTWEIEPVENKIIIFKSNLSHMVEKNKSKEDRVSIALNFFLKNK